MTGKKIGKDNIYIHFSALKDLPKDLSLRVAIAYLALYIRNCDMYGLNFVITHPDYISFVEAENFDNEYEPVLGRRIRVTNDVEFEFIGRLNRPRILHQRYKTVNADYDGFDIEADKRREKWYRSHLTPKDMCRAGYKHIWEKMLKNLPEMLDKS